MILNSGIEQEKDRPSKGQISDWIKPNTKKSISNKVRDIRRLLIHVLCGSGMLKILSCYHQLDSVALKIYD